MTRRPRGELSDVGDIQAGGDTARVRQSPDDKAHRAAQRAAARRSLDRRFPPEVADELAAALGLDDVPSSRDPGRCDCGTELPWDSACTQARRDNRRQGRCAACAQVGGESP